MNRRRVIQAAAAVAAAMALPLEASARAAGRAGATRPSHSAAPIAVAISDERYSDSRRFASALREQGACVFTSEPDLVDLWRNELVLLAGRRDIRIAGLTTRSDFEVMRMCAREAGLRVAYEACHDCRGSEHVAHHVKSYIGAGMIDPLRAARSDWIEALASALAKNDTSDTGSSRAIEAPQAPPRSADHPGFLTSWLIAPIPRFDAITPPRMPRLVAWSSRAPCTRGSTLL